MLVFAVIPQPFAVIRQQDDRCILIQALVSQVIEKASDDLVGVVDFAVVGIRRLDVRGRAVWAMGLVDVKEEKKLR